MGEQFGILLMLRSIGLIGIVIGFFAGIDGSLKDGMIFCQHRKLAAAAYTATALAFFVGALMLWMLWPASMTQLSDLPLYICVVVVTGVLLLAIVIVASWAFFTLFNAFVRGYYERVLKKE